MFPFTEMGPFDRTEKKALLFAALFCGLFIGLLSVFSPAKRVRQKRLTIMTSAPLTTPFEPPAPAYVDPLDQFRFVPENFSKVDFKNFSYGVYSISAGRPVSLTLNDGKMWDDSSWFNLEDVYYEDVTGDGSPEAIVRLLHLRCSGSCDGGADLFYIYSKRNGQLKNIWQYETGSYAYGCGLKSFSLKGKQVVLQLTNGCTKDVVSYPEPRILTDF